MLFQDLRFENVYVLDEGLRIVCEIQGRDDCICNYGDSIDDSENVQHSIALSFDVVVEDEQSVSRYFHCYGILWCKLAGNGNVWIHRLS